MQEGNLRALSRTSALRRIQYTERKVTHTFKNAEHLDEEAAGLRRLLSLDEGCDLAQELGSAGFVAPRPGRLVHDRKAERVKEGGEEVQVDLGVEDADEVDKREEEPTDVGAAREAEQEDLRRLQSQLDVKNGDEGVRRGRTSSPERKLRERKS